MSSSADQAQASAGDGGGPHREVVAVEAEETGNAGEGEEWLGALVVAVAQRTPFPGQSEDKWLPLAS